MCDGLANLVVEPGNGAEALGDGPIEVSEEADLAKVDAYKDIADQLLFDAKPPKGSELPGGNAVSFDWSLLTGLDPSIRYMLSGGLNHDNIGEAIKFANPPGLDLSSGVETAPGVKDVGLIREFLAAAA